MSLYRLESNKYEIALGYDQGLKSFWLVVHHNYGNSSHLNTPIFNNILHWPGVRMSINDVKHVLEKFQEKIPGKELYQLYLEAENCGYFSKLIIDDFRNPSRAHHSSSHRRLWKILNHFVSKKIDRFYCTS